MNVECRPPSIRRRARTVVLMVSGLAASLAVAASARAANVRVMAVGLGSGTITSNPAGISCGATCDRAFVNGTVVTFTATANPGDSTFNQWIGDCTPQNTT